MKARALRPIQVSGGEVPPSAGGDAEAPKVLVTARQDRLGETVDGERPRYLSNLPRLDRPKGYRGYLWSPWAWLTTAALALLNAFARSGRSAIDPVPLVVAAVVFITIPGVLLTLQAGLNAKMPARQLVIHNGRLWMMYPRTFHKGGAPGEPKGRGFKHKQPRNWINEGVPLSSLKVEAVWVGERNSLKRADPRKLGANVEDLAHQLDLTDGRKHVSLCRCADRGLQLLPVMLEAHAHLGADLPDPPLWGRPVPIRR